jgi:hypothetical protein
MGYKYALNDRDRRALFHLRSKLRRRQWEMFNARPAFCVTLQADAVTMQGFGMSCCVFLPSHVPP